jgi:radical SAM-linked protein
MLIWERAARRAGITLIYSAGFNPRPRVQIAAALPVGFTAGAELLDIWIDPPTPSAAVHQTLAETLPDGLGILSVEEVSLDEPALPTQVKEAVYTVRIETEQPSEEIRHTVESLLTETTLPRQRRGRPYDLRPLIHQIVLAQEQPGEVVLEMVLSVRQEATGRPEEVVDALGLSASFFLVHRQRLLLRFSDH